MKCTVCHLEIEGELLRCPETCLCEGKEGTIRKDDFVVGYVWKDTAYHSDKDSCIAALVRHVAGMSNYENKNCKKRT